jgi:hypothetical protein
MHHGTTNKQQYKQQLPHYFVSKIGLQERREKFLGDIATT